MQRLALALALAACPSNSPTPTPTPTPPTGSGSASDPWKASTEPSMELVVEEPGAAPRGELRYQFGGLERVLRFKTVDDRGEGFADMRYVWRCSPCTYQMTKFSVLGDTKTFEGLAKSIHGSVTVQPDGGTVIVPGTLMHTTPSTTELLELAIVRFPPEAIGVGARWSLREAAKRKTFTLVAATASGATVDVDLDESSTEGTAHVTGRLDVSFADPVATGKLTQSTKIMPDSKLSIPPIEHTTQIEIR